jgi:hypothetical protein
MKILRKTLLVGSILAFAWGLAYFARAQTSHFTNSRIISTHDFDPEWECDNPLEVEQILAQPYHYFTSGGQSWVFLSDDGQWVVKFFDFRPTWHDVAKVLHLPESWCPKLTDRQIKRRETHIKGYILAASRFRDGCGLVGVFLNGKQVGEHYLTITDPSYCKHRIDLSKCAFVVQRKAEPLPDRIQTLLKTGDTKEASLALSAVLNLVAERTALGLGDGDVVNFHKNLGFIGNKAIYLDAGGFIDAPEFLNPANAETEIVRSANLLIEKISQ